MNVPLNPSADQCAELVLRRCAATPVMADREQRGQSLAENDEMNADPNGEVSQNSGALHELAGMGDFLTERAIRRVFVDRVFVARQICLRVGHLRCWPCYQRLGNRHDADRRRTAGRLRNVDVRLNDQNLNRQGKYGKQNEQQARKRWLTYTRRKSPLLRGSPSVMPIQHHLCRHGSRIGYRQRPIQIERICQLGDGAHPASNEEGPDNRPGLLLLQTLFLS
jgi:hypothetical protein